MTRLSAVTEVMAGAEVTAETAVITPIVIEAEVTGIEAIKISGANRIEATGAIAIVPAIVVIKDSASTAD
ncbi:MAG: hypothetical protein JWQ21_848 [Herminiimonas sp.]|nr:hypothetical protein [Herminiimonas sp.]